MHTGSAAACAQALHAGSPSGARHRDPYKHPCTEMKSRTKRETKRESVVLVTGSLVRTFAAVRRALAADLQVTAGPYAHAAPHGSTGGSRSRTMPPLSARLPRIRWPPVTRPPHRSTHTPPPVARLGSSRWRACPLPAWIQPLHRGVSALVGRPLLGRLREGSKPAVGSPESVGGIY